MRAMKNFNFKKMSTAFFNIFLISSLWCEAMATGPNFINPSCESLQSQISQVEHFIRNRPVGAIEGITPAPANRGAAEELKARLQAQKAILEGLQMLRQRQIQNLAYLQNEESCQFYDKREERIICERQLPVGCTVEQSNQVPRPANCQACDQSLTSVIATDENRNRLCQKRQQRFFENLSDGSMKKLDEKLGQVKADAHNVYAMELTIQNILGNDANQSLGKLLKEAPPAEGVHPFVSQLQTRCNQHNIATDGAQGRLCNLLVRGVGIDSAQRSATINLIDRFARAFYAGYNLQGATGSAAATRRAEAEKALKDYRKILTEAPLSNGMKEDGSMNSGESFLAPQVASINGIVDGFKTVYTNSLDCMNRKASGQGAFAPVNDAVASVLDADPKLRAEMALEDGAEKARIISGRTAAQVETGLRACKPKPSATELGPVMRNLNQHRQSVRESLAAANMIPAIPSSGAPGATAPTSDPLCTNRQANPNGYSLSACFVLADEGFAHFKNVSDNAIDGHEEELKGWLAANRYNSGHQNSAKQYMFGKINDEVGVAEGNSRKVRDPNDRPAGAAKPASISQFKNLRNFLINAANRAQLETKLNGATDADRVLAASSKLKHEDINSDVKLAKYFLKQMKNYQDDLFGGPLLSHCPGDATRFANVAAIDSANEEKLMTSLHDCIQHISATDGAPLSANRLESKIADLNQKIAKVDTGLANEDSTRVKAQELKNNLAKMLSLTCRGNQIGCPMGVARTIDDVTPEGNMRYFVSSTGQVLSKVAPGMIVSTRNVNDLHGNIQRLCTESIPNASGAAATTLAGSLGTVCSMHYPVLASVTPGNAVEYSAADRAATGSRLEYLRDNHVTFDADGKIATSTPTKGVGGALLIGGASAFAGVLAPALIQTMQIDAETNMLVANAKFNVTQQALFDQQFQLANSGFFAFGGPTVPFQLPSGGGFGGGGFGFGGAEYGAYMSSF